MKKLGIPAMFLMGGLAACVQTGSGPSAYEADRDPWPGGGEDTTEDTGEDTPEDTPEDTGEDTPEDTGPEDTF